MLLLFDLLGATYAGYTALLMFHLHFEELWNQKGCAYFLGRVDKKFCPSSRNDSLCKKCDNTATDNFIDILRYFLQVSAVSTAKKKQYQVQNPRVRI